MLSREICWSIKYLSMPPLCHSLNPLSLSLSIPRLEQEFRKLKGELQASRQSEQELRSHVCNLTNSERSLRPEVSLLRQNNELLQSK